MQERIINWVMWLIMALLFGYFAYTQGWLERDFKNISPQEAHALLQRDNNISLIDVRSLKEFQKDHIVGALHAPMESLQTFPPFVEGKALVVYSERGERSMEASRILAKRGFRVLQHKGGVVFWIRAGYKLGSTPNKI